MSNGVEATAESSEESGLSLWRYLRQDDSFIARLVVLCVVVVLGAASYFLVVWQLDGERERTGQFWVFGVTGVLAIGIVGLALLGAVRRRASEDRQQRKEGRNPSDVAYRLLSETGAMLDYALSKGLDVESQHLITVYEAQAAVEVAAAPPPVGPGIIFGSRTPSAAPSMLTTAAVRELAAAHEHLVEVVRPATPSTLALLRERQPSAFFEPLGRVRLIRHMLYVAVVFLLAALAIIIAADPLSTGDDAIKAFVTVVPQNLEGGDDGVAEPILGDERTDRLWNSLFLVVVAGLGAAFFALYTATRYVKQNSYDEQYEATYWIRFVLGLVGGFTLALIVGDEFIGDDSIGIPLLAFIGGFSADVVQRVLQRVVDTVDALIRGSADYRVEDQLRGYQSQAAMDVAAARLRIAAPLLALEQQLASNAPTDEVRRQLREIVREAMPFGAVGGIESDAALSEDRDIGGEGDDGDST
ncbi:MAG: hypothetical protein AAFP84_12015 [Actinomycetota bacterium]